ncbi:MAG TPA: response regulator [Paucimonas sp.]|nr:response regulator [Paucimonas sp.]
MMDTSVSEPMILFVDDEPAAVKYFQRAIDSLAPVVTADSVEEGKRLLDRHADTLAVLMSDQRMPGEYGNELLRYASNRHPHIVRILTTTYSELDDTAEAINEGPVQRYLQKPLDLAALRIELKQAMEFAAVRKERDRLLREKIAARQKQLIASRISALYSICSTIAGSACLQPVETYLNAARNVGMRRPDADWLQMDYTDLMCAEALRSGAYGDEVRRALFRMGQSFAQYDGDDTIQALAELWPGKVCALDDQTYVLANDLNLAEFLETPSQSPASPDHADWLAFLMWLDRRGQSLQVTQSDAGLECRVTQDNVPLPRSRLAAWIKQF